MREYPKKVMPINNLLLKEKEKGLNFKNIQEAEEFTLNVGYYRLRGYWFQLYDVSTGKFKEDITFEKIKNIYEFDTELRKILFYMASRIEVSLRSRFCEAILEESNDPIAYLDPSFFDDKTLFWSNTALISKEINRSKDVFIIHNINNHDGNIPIWAAVEVMSFGTLSKFISNLSQENTVFTKLAAYYEFTTKKGNSIKPKSDWINSWIKATVILRNTCAHNSRIYNRSLATKPKLLDMDKQPQQPQFYGLYQQLLAMKYLKPSKKEWIEFVHSFDQLLKKYSSDIDINCLGLCHDWRDHLLNTVI